MRAVLQRVKWAKVEIEGETVGEIGPGLLVFLGVAGSDTEKDMDTLARKIPALRIFEDEQGKMNRSLIDSGGRMLAVSQFTLYGDCRKGRRPGFAGAAAPDLAAPLYEKFCDRCRKMGIHVETGRFAAMMDVSLCNDGPVTMLLDSSKLF
jgi:D-aminoacyl-tRNA deacylase